MTPAPKPAFLQTSRDAFDGIRRRLRGWMLQAVSDSSEPSVSEGVGATEASVFAQIESLELVATQVVDGMYAGLHRSRRLGGTSDFKEYRPYGQGDELRRVDWRLFARRDRAYVRQFVNETNLHAWLVVDASGSMAFGRSTPTKYRYAQLTAAAIGRLLLRQRDAVGLIIRDARRDYRLAPRCRPSHWQAILAALENIKPKGPSDLVSQLNALCQRTTRPGMVIVISDCFLNVDELSDVIKRLRARHQEIVLFQVLAPEELTFPFQSVSEFKDIELPGRHLSVDAGRIRQAYLTAFQSFQTQLADEMVRSAVDYQILRTDRSPGDALVRFLARRKVAGRTIPHTARELR